MDSITINGNAERAREMSHPPAERGTRENMAAAEGRDTTANWITRHSMKVRVSRMLEK